MNEKKNPLDLDTKLIIALAALLLVLVGAFAAAFLLPPVVDKPVMPEGDVAVYARKDGGLELFWPALPEGQTCLVRVKEQGEARFVDAEGSSEEDCFVLSTQRLSAPVQVRFYAAAEGKNLLGVRRTAESENYLEITLNYLKPTSPQDLTSRIGADGSLELSWTREEGVRYEICTVERNQCKPVKSVESGSARLRFGEDGDLAMPGQNRTAAIALRWVMDGPGYTLYSPLSETVELGRDDLLSGKLALEYQQTGERLYTLRWKETKGDYYEVQAWNREENRWESVQQVDAGDELVYETGRVGSGTDCRYQVTAYQQASAGPQITAGPEEVSFRADISPLYATVWPILDQPLRSAASENSAVLSTIPGGTALCVLEEKDGFFSVRYQNKHGYVDSRFCMINLPEYVGSLCAYSITNSYSSVFKVHNYPIDQVTGQVIQGFENVRQADGSCLVPLLYPTAQKLIKAAEAAEKDGYRLKIYEAFRPNEATRFLYDTTLAQLDTPLLDSSGAPLPADSASEDSTAVPIARSIARSMPDPETETEEEPEPVLPPDVVIDGEEPDTTPEQPTPSPEEPAAAPEEQPSEPAQQPSPPKQEEPEKPKEPAYLTLGKVMTGGRFNIGAFLAKSVSNHNRGVALDLTLETWDSAQELEMQSAIHDLSWYAITDRNNDNARLLEKYMKDAGGLAGLTSEWWHFQDDQLREELELSGYLDKGVSVVGWKKDDKGWQYRKPDGTLYRSGTIEIDGQRYKMGSDGYVVE